MDIKTLRCFVAAAEHLNFSRAAEAVYISQPTLSLRIQELEEELNVRLFYRDRQKVFLTNEGSVLLPAVREILEKLDALPAAVKSAGAPPARSLVIGFDPTEDRKDMRPTRELMTNFRKLVPGVEVSIVATDYEHYEQSLMDGSIDLCFIVFGDSDPLPPDFVRIPLLRETMVLAAAHAGGMTREEVLRTRSIVLLDSERHRRWNELYADYLRKTMPDSCSIVLIEPTTIEMNLLYGNTASFLPNTYVEELNGDFTVFPTEIGDVTLSLVWNKHNLNSALQVFINEARTEMANRGRKKRR